MKNEHLDNLVRHFADCVDHGFQRISRRWRTDPSVIDIRSDLFDPAFCDGTKHGLNGAGRLIIDCGDCSTSTVPAICLERCDGNSSAE